MHLIVAFIYIAVIGAVLFCMAALLFRGEDTVSTRMFMGCQGMVVLWCGSQILQMMAGTRGELWASFLIGNLGICFMGSAWLYFSLSYCGKELKGILKYLPMASSIFHYAMVASNGLHHMYYPDFSMDMVEHGPFFYTNVTATYGFIFLGMLVLYRHMGREERFAKRLVIAAVLVPLALNALYLFRVIKPSFDVTPMGFAISVVLIMLATWKYRFMNLKKELAITNEKLLLAQERNRIAQQVHDTAGHTLTMIQSYMKLAEVSAGAQKYDEVKSYLSEARTLTGQGIRELRESINMLRREEEYELVTQGVMHLAGQVKEIPVEVTVRGEDGSRYSHLSKTVYDTVRESITNTLKYAGATKMDVIVRFQNDYLEVVIADDGDGCKTVKENNGIRGIRERIKKVGGTVTFTTAEGEGFMTRVRIPV